jgi:hypothetical protein
MSWQPADVLMALAMGWWGPSLLSLLEAVYS